MKSYKHFVKGLKRKPHVRITQSHRHVGKTTKQRLYAKRKVRIIRRPRSLHARIKRF
jgi:hypothetical protein